MDGPDHSDRSLGERWRARPTLPGQSARNGRASVIAMLERNTQVSKIRNENAHSFSRYPTITTPFFFISWCCIINSRHPPSTRFARLPRTIVLKPLNYFVFNIVSKMKFSMTIAESPDRAEQSVLPETPFGAETKPPEKSVSDPEHDTYTPENKELPRTITGWKVSILVGVCGVSLPPIANYYMGTVGPGLFLPDVNSPALCPGQHHREYFGSRSDYHNHSNGPLRRLQQSSP